MLISTINTIDFSLRIIPCEKLAKGCDTCDSDDVNNYVRRGRLLKYIKKNNLGKYQVYLENSKTRRNSF